MLKKIISSILILPFLIVPMFCCCNTVQASSERVEHCDDDHAASADHQEHSKSNHSHSSCDCHSFSTAAEQASTAQITFLSFPNVFPVSDVVILNKVPHFKGSLHLAYLGPPLGRASPVSLYTLYHSLRI